MVVTKGVVGGTGTAFFSFRLLHSSLIMRLRRFVVASGVGGVLVAFFAQTGCEFLHDLDLEQVPQVCQTAFRDEEVLDSAGGTGGVIVGGDSEGEGGFGEEFGGCDVQSVDFVITDAHAVDDGFGAEAGHFDNVLHR